LFDLFYLSELPLSYSINHSNDLNLTLQTLNPERRTRNKPFKLFKPFKHKTRNTEHGTCNNSPHFPLPIKNSTFTPKLFAPTVRI